MTIEIKAPTFPESIKGGVFSELYAHPGDLVHQDDLLFDIETDKVILEVVAPVSGKVTEYLVNIGDHVLSNQVLGVFEPCEVIEKELSSGQKSQQNENPIPEIEEPKINHKIETSSNKFPTIVGFVIGFSVGVILTLAVVLI